MKFRVYNRENVSSVGYAVKPSHAVNLQLICDEVDGKPDGTTMSLSFEGDDFKDLPIGTLFELNLAPSQSVPLVVANA